MKKQTDKHWKEMIYKINDMMFSELKKHHDLKIIKETRW